MVVFNCSAASQRCKFYLHLNQVFLRPCNARQSIILYLMITPIFTLESATRPDVLLSRSVNGKPSTLPTSFLADPPDDVHQCEQYRNLNQGPYRRREGLITVRAKCRNGNSNRKFKVVARGSKTLGCGELVSKA